MGRPKMFENNEGKISVLLPAKQKEYLQTFDGKTLSDCIRKLVDLCMAGKVNLSEGDRDRIENPDLRKLIRWMVDDMGEEGLLTLLKKKLKDRL